MRLSPATITVFVLLFGLAGPAMSEPKSEKSTTPVPGARFNITFRTVQEKSSQIAYCDVQVIVICPNGEEQTHHFNENVAPCMKWEDVTAFSKKAFENACRPRPRQKADPREQGVRM